MARGAEQLVQTTWRGERAREVYSDFNGLTLQITTDALFGFHASTPDSQNVTGLSHPPPPFPPLTLNQIPNLQTCAASSCRSSHFQASTLGAIHSGSPERDSPPPPQHTHTLFPSHSAPLHEVNSQVPPLTGDGGAEYGRVIGTVLVVLEEGGGEGRAPPDVGTPGCICG